MSTYSIGTTEIQLNEYISVNKSNVHISGKIQVFLNQIEI